MIYKYNIITCIIPFVQCEESDRVATYIGTNTEVSGACKLTQRRANVFGT